MTGPARPAVPANPYAGLRAVIATMHGKAAAIAPPLARATGLRLEATADIDTDTLGTFSGETPRAGTMLEAAIAKARLGMAATGCPVGVASEGSFGPHPAAPFIAAATELIVLVDDRLGFAVHETLTSETTNFGHVAVSAPGDALDTFLARAGFPGHAVIVRSNAGAGAILKGLTHEGDVNRAAAEAAALSADGLARIETDMRAHLNPTRMGEIRRLAERFADRLSTLCPNCGTPGFGPVRSVRGLPCADCGAPTALVKAIASACPRCSHTVIEGRSDGLASASPAQCPECNP